MANIIPMAGIGSRFSKEGYLLPKPLIQISGKPMIIRVIESLPDSDKWIFIVRSEFVKKHSIDNLIKSKIPNAIIIEIGRTTSGQASTCMLAMKYLKPDEPMFVAACDNGFLYDKNSYKKLIAGKNVDSIVWTFTKNKLLSENPFAWGYVQTESDKITIKEVSVKKPVSNNPYNDHAIVASFYFRKAKDFKQAYDLMKKENFRVNEEFYIDSIPIFLKKLGKRSVLFDVKLYVGWGKPSDLNYYHEMEYFYKMGLTPKGVKNWPDWKKFFDSLK